MVIDASAVLSILLNEPDRDQFIDAIQSDAVRLMSAVNALEAAIVVEARKREPGAREFDLLVHKAQISVVPFAEEHLEAARAAWRRFGKGNHPAGLNFCDCCAYALAKLAGEPLLFKGEDFSQTDLVAARTPVKTVESRPTFPLTLHKTYFRQGFFNVPVDCGRFFGPHQSTIEVHCEGVSRPIRASINRTANQNGAPRVMGGVPLRAYFRGRLRPGDLLEVRIESPHRIWLRPSPEPAGLTREVSR